VNTTGVIVRAVPLKRGEDIFKTLVEDRNCGKKVDG